MNGPGCHLLLLVQEAQNGNKIALWTIIQKFYPAVMKVRRKINIQQQDDLEQEIFEKMIRAILNFDLNTPVDQHYFRNAIKSFVNEEL